MQSPKYKVFTAHWTTEYFFELGHFRIDNLSRFRDKGNCSAPVTARVFSPFYALLRATLCEDSAGAAWHISAALGARASLLVRDLFAFVGIRARSQKALRN